MHAHNTHTHAHMHTRGAVCPLPASGVVCPECGSVPQMSDRETQKENCRESYATTTGANTSLQHGEGYTYCSVSVYQNWSSLETEEKTPVYWVS